MCYVWGVLSGNEIREAQLIIHITSCASGTAKVWLGFASLHILAKHYQPLNRALYGNHLELKHGNTVTEGN